MKANNAQLNFNDNRKKELISQQDRLKSMAATSDEAQFISPDFTMDNFFTKIPQTPFVSQIDKSNSELPLWLQCESSAVPAQYKYLWSMIEASPNLANTQKVSQLLLTSGLPVDVLGFIWSLANKAIPGQLTKQEFYIVLALVSLAQSGYKFSDLNVLNLITVPSPPVLHIDIQNCSALKLSFHQNQQMPKQNELTSSPIKQSMFLKNINENMMVKDYFISSPLIDSAVVIDDSNKSSNRSSALEFGLLKQNAGFSNSYLPYPGSALTSELDDDFSAFQSGCTATNENSQAPNISADDSGDDFSDFQSANVEFPDPFQTVIINKKREVPKISLQKTLTGKFNSFKSNMLKISPETEKKFKVLPPAESISSLPESKISSSNKVSTSISLLGSNHGIGSRLANHSLNNKLSRSKFHKHHKIKINPVSPSDQNSNEEIIFGVNSKNLETVIPKCHPKYLNACKSFTLKETKIINDISEPSCIRDIENEPDPFTSYSGESTRQIEIPMLGTFNETILPTQTKPQTTDLIAVQEDKYSALREIELELNKHINSDVKEGNDDFGDFLSADIFITMPLTNKEKKNWGDWNVSTAMNSFGFATLNSHSNIVNSTEAKNNLFETFELLTVKENDNQTSQLNLYSLKNQDCFGSNTKENTEDDLIEPSENADIVLKLNQALNLQSDNQFWDILSNDMKPLSAENSSRHDSLSSLDLKISQTEELEQETVWRKCLDSCHNLIQDGFQIFNNISAKSILDEVFASQKTEDYLNNLNIVFQISKRVSQNFDQLPAKQEKLEKFWGRLQDLCFEYNVKLKRNENTGFERKIKCSICFKHIGYNIVTQGTSNYHSSCANLWINCVEATLPFPI